MTETATTETAMIGTAMTEANVWFVAAAVWAVVVCLIHLVAGGRHVARPLLAAADIHRVSKYTNYFCWHFATIALAGTAVLFAVAAVDPGARALAIVAVVFNALAVVLNVAIWTTTRIGPRLMPQWSLLGLTAGLGAMGLA